MRRSVLVDAPSKYGNRRTEVEGIRFDSQLEARWWVHLRLLERAGKISDLKRQVRFALAAGIVYVADFTFIEDGKLVAADTKGVETAVFKVKKRLFQDRYPGIELRILRA